MADVTKEMIEAACRDRYSATWYKWQPESRDAERDKVGAMLGAAFSAAPQAVPVQIKPLEWTARGDGFGHEYAYSVVGKWEVNNRGLMWPPRGGDIGLKCGKSMEAAKAAAQADYTARIMSAIQPAQVEPVAYAAFTEDGKIRIWSQTPGHIDATAAVDGYKVKPLYTTPPALAVGVPDGIAREECAALIDAMLTEAPWKDQKWARMALTIAARAVRRGRHLTAQEKAENAMNWIEGVDA